MDLDEDGDAPTPQELRFDPLMSHMRRELQGTDYSCGALAHSQRLSRIDGVLDALKAQGRVPECAVIDKPLQRIALNAMLDPLYAHHREQQLPESGLSAKGRHGLAATDLYFHALTEHLKREGFTPEASAAFDDLGKQARQDESHYMFEALNRFAASPDPEVVAAQQAARHRYTGDDDFARWRSQFNDQHDMRERGWDNPERRQLAKKYGRTL